MYLSLLAPPPSIPGSTILDTPQLNEAINAPLSLTQLQVTKSTPSSTTSKPTKSSPKKGSTKLQKTVDCEEESDSEGGVRVQCPICKKIFRQTDILRAHILEHDPGKLFQCGMCGKSYSTRAQLFKHHEGHTGPRPFKCEICQKQYPSKSLLGSHMRGVHELKTGAVNCDQCGLACETPIALRKHKKTHGYPCIECGKTYPKKSTLKAHILTHTKTKSHECGVCGKLFLHKHTLKLHQKYVHTEAKNFVCETCGSAFKRKDALKVHTYTHSDEKRFNCEVCHAGFVEKRSLKKHHCVRNANANHAKPGRASGQMQRQELGHSAPPFGHPMYWQML